MFGSLDPFVLPLLTGVGVFSLVGLIWNLTEGYFEQRKEQR